MQSRAWPPCGDMPRTTDKILWTYILTPLDFSNKYADMVPRNPK